MSSPYIQRPPSTISTAVPIRSHFNHSSRSLSLSARTRSMSKLAVITNSRNENTAFAGSKHSAKRQPLMETLVNARALDVGKRKTDDDGDRPKKILRTESSVHMAYHKPTTPTHKRTPLARITTPPQTRLEDVLSRPTPARDLLPHHADEEESTSPTDSPENNHIPRPPTPPRPHIPSSRDDDTPQLSTTPKRALTPDEEIHERPIKLDSIRRLDFTKLASGAASPRRPMGPVRQLSALGQEREQHGINAFEGERKTRPPMDATSDTPGPSTAKKSTSTLQPKPSPAVAPSPRRVMAGMSRLRLSAPPQSPIKDPTFGSSSSNTGSADVLVQDDQPTHAQICQEKPILVAGSSSVPGRRPASAETPILQRVHENEELEVPLESASKNVEEIPKPAQISLPNSTSTRTLSAMGPPSRIPMGVRSSRPITSQPSKASGSRSITEKQDLPPSTARTGSSISGLPRSTASVTTSTLGKGLPSSSSTTTEEPIRRKPSYPSSLGSGPLARQTQRMVSNPVMPLRPPSTTSMEVDDSPRRPVSPRSVSAPAASNRLSMSTSRREGLSLETSQRVNGLSEALEKLKMKKTESSSRLSLAASVSRPSLAASTSQIAQSRQSMPASSSMRLSTVHRPRQSLAPPTADISVDGETGEAGARSLAALMCSTSGGGCLRGVVAFVDVRTEEGADTSAIFGDILKTLGAKVLGRPTESCTHIVYKSGKPTTLSWWRRQDPKPHIVGISWVTKSKEKGERLDEARFVVDVAEEDVFQKRRKSMEPKAFALMNSVGRGNTEVASIFSDRPAVLAEVRRKSMLYAPRISSPLKKAYRRDITMQDEED